MTLLWLAVVASLASCGSGREEGLPYVPLPREAAVERPAAPAAPSGSADAEGSEDADATSFLAVEESTGNSNSIKWMGIEQRRLRDGLRDLHLIQFDTKRIMDERAQDGMKGMGIKKPAFLELDTVQTPYSPGKAASTSWLETAETATSGTVRYSMQTCVNFLREAKALYKLDLSWMRKVLAAN